MWHDGGKEIRLGKWQQQKPGSEGYNEVESTCLGFFLGDLRTRKPENPRQQKEAQTPKKVLHSPKAI